MGIIMITEPDDDITKKKMRPILLMNIDTKKPPQNTSD